MTTTFLRVMRAEILWFKLCEGRGSYPGGLHVAWLAQHLVDLTGVLLFSEDHLAGVLLEHHRAALNRSQELLVKHERRRFVLHRFPHDHPDIVLVAVEQRPDGERRILAQMRNQLARLLGMHKRFSSLFSQP